MTGTDAISAAPVSVVINTNGRCTSLIKTIEALSWQRYPNFEICVVAGPTRDGTHEFLAEATATRRLKSAECSEANLSSSRNIGIALAAGDFIAFIDDDALAEPVWLEHLISAFDRPGVAGVSGLVFEPDGRRAQFRYSTCDRFGNAAHNLDHPADDGAFPFSAHFPHVMGTNAMFRREALVAVGGFDEEYEYYLDEADLCCRLIDAGYLICQRADGPVHHKFLAGTVRDGEGIVVRRYPILKNQLYFALVNGRSHATLPSIVDQSLAFARWHRHDIADHVAHGRLHNQALVAFDADWDRAMSDAMVRGMFTERRMPPQAMFAAPPAFLPYLASTANKGRSQSHHVIIVDERASNAASLSASARAKARQLTEKGDFARLVILAGPDRTKSEGAEVIGGAWCHYVVAQLVNTDPPSLRQHPAVIEVLTRIGQYHAIDVIEDLAHA